MGDETYVIRFLVTRCKHGRAVKAEHVDKFARYIGAVQATVEGCRTCERSEAEAFRNRILCDANPGAPDA